MKVLPCEPSKAGIGRVTLLASNSEFEILKSLVEGALKYTPKVTDCLKTINHLKEMKRKFNNPTKN